MKGIIEFDKVAKIGIATGGDKAVLSATIAGDTKNTNLTDAEWRQIGFIINRTGLINIQDAEDVVGQSTTLLETIQRQAVAIDESRNQLSAANGTIDQLKGVNSTLETKTAELETFLTSEKSFTEKALQDLGKAVEDNKSAEATIAQLREVINGLQTKVDDLTEKLTAATTIVEGVATVEKVEDDSKPTETTEEKSAEPIPAT